MIYFDITLPIEITNSNDGQGHQWQRTASKRKSYEKALRLLGHVRTPLNDPCIVWAVRILGKGQRLWDYSSVLRGSYKQLEDACVACGWWNNDGPLWIRGAFGLQDDSQREIGPATRIIAASLDHPVVTLPQK